MDATRPNILFICTDQHRHDFVGYRPSAPVRTPQLDALAAQGTVFTQCTTPSPVCGPARCALASGLAPRRIGCLANRDDLPPRVPTCYQRLRDHGYWTGFTGKLDLTKRSEARQDAPDGRMPQFYAHGFCDPIMTGESMVPGMRAEHRPYFAHLAAKGLLEAFNADRASRSLLPGLVDVMNCRTGDLDLRTASLPRDWVARVSQDFPLGGEDHSDGYCVDAACRWLECAAAQRHAPWFLQVNLSGPHDPFDPPGAFAAAHRGADVPDPIPADYAGKPAWVAQRYITDDQESIRFTRRQYAASVAFIDHLVGRLLAQLAAVGQRERTVIVLSADHGEMLGDFGLYIKHVPYEASMRVPLLMCGPGIPQGRVSEALVEMHDLNPTFCDWAGVPMQEGIDARSLVPLLRGTVPDDGHRDSQLCEEHNFSCVRTRRWKYIHSHNDRSELYDLAADPQERCNLLAAGGAGRELVGDMKRLLVRRQTEGG